MKYFTADRMISGEVLKYLNVFFVVIHTN